MNQWKNYNFIRKLVKEEEKVMIHFEGFLKIKPFIDRYREKLTLTEIITELK